MWYFVNGSRGEQLQREQPRARRARETQTVELPGAFKRREGAGSLTGSSSDGVLGTGRRRTTQKPADPGGALDPQPQVSLVEPTYLHRHCNSLPALKNQEILPQGGKKNGFPDSLEKLEALASRAPQAFGEAGDRLFRLNPGCLSKRVSNAEFRE